MIFGDRFQFSFVEHSDLFTSCGQDSALFPVAANAADTEEGCTGHLREILPREGEGWLSEETVDDSSRLERKRVWVVDPLDGTKEFIAQNGEFSVMVGLSISGRAAVGAVFQPDPGVLYLGWTGGGAWSVPVILEGEDVVIESPATLRLEPESAGPVRLIRSRSHPDPLLAELEARLSDSETVLCGSVGVKCARIAVDEADVYVHPVAFLKEWDTCAPEAVLRGAGGQVTDCAADPLTYGKADPRQPHGIFAARPGAWGSLRPMVREIAAPILVRDS